MATLFGRSGKLAQKNHCHFIKYILCMHMSHFIYEHNLILGRIFQTFFIIFRDPPPFSISCTLFLFLFLPSNSPVPLDVHIFWLCRLASFQSSLYKHFTKEEAFFLSIFWFFPMMITKTMNSAALYNFQQHFFNFSK